MSEIYHRRPLEKLAPARKQLVSSNFLQKLLHLPNHHIVKFNIRKKHILNIFSMRERNVDDINVQCVCVLVNTQ